MNGTEQFKVVIKAFLDNYAQKDKEFAEKYATTSRTMDDVASYIINQVKISGCAGFPDDEIYAMAIHVIDEPELEIGKPIPCEIVVNKQVQLTEEEKAEARSKAILQYQQEELQKIQAKNNRPKPTAKKPETDNQPSFFDMFGNDESKE